jgi:nitrite reductase/ring-hydroxylating ferredoxin subunit/uncharacterized membrane protein
MRELNVVRSITALESADGLDPIVAKAGGLFEKLLASQRLRDLLHGVPFGHPVHPVAVQVPIGAFTSVAVLDLVPGTAKPARLLVGFGVASILPAVAAGWADWLQLHEQQKRVGIVHAAANVTAVVLYAASFLQRTRGKQASGKLLAAAGFSVLAGAGFLGGHLAYRQAAGANHAEHVPHLFPQGWQLLGSLNSFEERRASRVDVAGQPLLVYRTGEHVQVLSNTCSHLSAPLDEGSVEDGCIICPWHGSTFELETGDVVHGPATAPQPRFETRILDGQVQVLLQGAG